MRSAGGGFGGPAIEKIEKFQFLVTGSKDHPIFFCNGKGGGVKSSSGKQISSINMQPMSGEIKNNC